MSVRGNQEQQWTNLFTCLHHDVGNRRQLSNGRKGHHDIAHHAHNLMPEYDSISQMLLLGVTMMVMGLKTFSIAVTTPAAVFHFYIPHPCVRGQRFVISWIPAHADCVS